MTSSSSERTELKQSSWSSFCFPRWELQAHNQTGAFSSVKAATGACAVSSPIIRFRRLQHRHFFQRPGLTAICLQSFPLPLQLSPLLPKNSPLFLLAQSLRAFIMTNQTLSGLFYNYIYTYLNLLLNYCVCVCVCVCYTHKSAWVHLPVPRTEKDITVFIFTKQLTLWAWLTGQWTPRICVCCSQQGLEAHSNVCLFLKKKRVLET